MTVPAELLGFRTDFKVFLVVPFDFRLLTSFLIGLLAKVTKKENFVRWGEEKGTGQTKMGRGEVKQAGHLQGQLGL